MFPYEIYVKYQSHIEEACIKYGISQAWVCSKIFRESSGIPTKYREEPQIEDASYGLMQVLWKTAQTMMKSEIFDVPKIEKPEELFNPRIAILYGTAYFAFLLDLNKGCYRCAEACYVSGEARFATSTGDLFVNKHVNKIEEWANRLINDSRYRKLHKLDVGVSSIDINYIKQLEERIIELERKLEKRGELNAQEKIN